MFKFATIIAAQFAVLASATQPAPSIGTVASEDLICKVEVKQIGPNLRIRALAESGRSGRGTYSLEIRKSGASGSAVIAQSGDFTLRAGKTETLSTAALTGSERHIRTRLILDWAGRKIACLDNADPIDL